MLMLKPSKSLRKPKDEKEEPFRSNMGCHEQVEY
jgi:hypothetical protein